MTRQRGDVATRRLGSGGVRFIVSGCHVGAVRCLLRAFRGLTRRGTAASRWDMAAMLRSRILPVGLVFLVLGVGNWSVSHNKIVEYTERSRAGNSMDSVTTFSDFPQLTAHTNDTVLERLHRDSTEYTFTDAKLDFYRVVEGGGRLFAVLGLLLITVGIVQSWWETRASLGAGADGSDFSSSS